MTTWKSIFKLLIAAGLLAGPSGAATLDLVFKPMSGDQPLIMDDMLQRTAAGESYGVTRLSYFVSGLGAQKADGTWSKADGSVFWLDLSKKRDRASMTGLKTGGYRALRFFIGLDPASNASRPESHAPDHALNPNLNGLHWAWLGGYIFIALEGRCSTGEGGPQGYAMHLGGDAFRTEVVIEHAFTLGENTTLIVDFDVTKVMDGKNRISFAKDGATTHAREGDPLALMLKENLGRAFRINGKVGDKETAAEADISASSKSSLTLFSMGQNFPQPALPADNPPSEARLVLGRRLFHETLLSRDGSISCASCHQSGLAFSDPRRFSVGVEGRKGDRNGMPLFNLAWKSEFFWDGRAKGLRNQVLVPIQDHREMDESLDRVIEKLKDATGYPADFQRAFDSPGITVERLGLALENFLLSLTSHDSKFDRAQRGEVELSADEKRGFELFMTEREPRLGAMGADCFHCHGGALFTDHQFRNNGLAILESDTGRHRVTRSALDRGAFSTPSLRNIALTAPYMHDGRFATLEEVLDHYSTGVKRTDTLDPNLAKHPDGGLRLTAEEKRCVLAFLKTLTDETLEARMTNDE
jgi:cytochrome c peroxidase